MKRKLNLIIGLLLILTVFNPLYSGKTLFPTDQEYTNIQDTTSLKKGRLIAVISGVSAAYLGSMSYLQYVWYKDDKRVPFEFYNDLGGYNQVDKFGHIYGAYLESYIGFHSLLWAGVENHNLFY